MENNKKNSKENLLNILKEISTLLNPIYLLTIICQILLIVNYYINNNSSLLLLFITSLMYPIAFIFSKDFYNEQDQLKYFNKLKKITVLAFILIINHLCSKLIYNLSKMNTDLMITGKVSTSSKSLLGLSLALSLITFLIFVLIFKSEGFKKFQEELFKTNILSKLNLTNENMPKDGDVYLCTNSETKEKVRIPYTDRFLHMLVIGPTGCGKTSQIIIPLLNQDMQNKEAGIIVIEPKGDLANMAFAMAQYYGRKAIYFNPELKGCPSFNPLYGKEEDVIENIVTTFKMLDPDAKQYFQDMNEQLLRNALKILKRLKKNKANLIDLNTLISNPGGEGRTMVNSFMRTPGKNESEQKENIDCATYFLENYYNEKSKTYENCSGVRSQVAKITSNKFLRKILNPESGKSDLDFSKHLRDGDVLCITTAQGKLRDLGSFLGYFIILNLQSAVFKRSGNEDTRRPCFLYIDEFQKYSNKGFADMLTQGRSYRVASHLATQSRAQIGMGNGHDGDAFINLVSTNCRNVIVFPGVSYDDAKYYSDQFGEITQIKTVKGKSYAQFNPLYGIKDVGYPTISERDNEEIIAKFSPTSIIYKEAKHITADYIKDMVVQPPLEGIIDYIDFDINKRLKTMVYENEYIMKYGTDPNLCRNLDEIGAPLLNEWSLKLSDIIAFVDEEERLEDLGEENDKDKDTKKILPVSITDGEFDTDEDLKNQVIDFTKIKITSDPTKNEEGIPIQSGELLTDKDNKNDDINIEISDEDLDDA